jgi:hypothetical protein
MPYLFLLFDRTSDPQISRTEVKLPAYRAGLPADLPVKINDPFR